VVDCLKADRNGIVQNVGFSLEAGTYTNASTATNGGHVI
jgi:hypothetical protein